MPFLFQSLFKLLEVNECLAVLEIGTFLNKNLLHNCSKICKLRYECCHVVIVIRPAGISRAYYLPFNHRIASIECTLQNLCSSSLGNFLPTFLQILWFWTYYSVVIVVVLLVFYCTYIRLLSLSCVLLVSVPFYNGI